MKYQMTVVCLFFAISLSAQASLENTSKKISMTKKIKVYLLGTFHFTQTGADYNVMDSKHQKSISELCDFVIKQKPNKVFIERQPEYEFRAKIDSSFIQYVKNDVLRYKNEMYQVGFRVAKAMGHSKVYQCDHPGSYGKHYRASLEYAKSNHQIASLDAQATGTAQRHDDLVNEDSLMANSSLLDYMRWINTDEVMTTLHANYITTFPQVGSTNYYDYDEDDSLIGAELLADWYRRNIMIYTKMINQLDYTEDAIFLIMGGDHIPILKNLFRDNPFFEVVDVKDWLY